ncbi:MAG TPA: DUF6524 family protein [Vicinamibacterales bacterium]|nr:DUF6524 family protein [Vicinamibacterales bacterium]HOQ59730.1 DUF6524 family protein [Vicinamibacterales bacterium]HPK70815.1 DUF6524 family protein [Vicinamibacterales bacterium]
MRSGARSRSGPASAHLGGDPGWPGSESQSPHPRGVSSQRRAGQATVVRMLVEYRVIDSTGRSTLVWIGLVMAGIVPGMGLSWPLVRARIVGQIEVD